MQITKKKITITEVKSDEKDKQNTKDQKIIDNKYVICLRDVLGTGTYASVYKGHFAENPQMKVAIKIISLARFNAKSKEHILKSFHREYQISSKLNNPNIVKFIDVCQNNEYYYLILEYCEEGNLKKILDQQPNRQFQFQQAFDVFSAIIHGYETLYHAKVIHRDLKPENIIFKEGIAKIADFGFAKIVDDMDVANAHTFLGTPLYCAPEIFEGKPYDSKADVWSLGCIFYEMVYGRVPFNASHIPNLVKQAKQGISKFPQDVQVDDNALNLLMGMLQPDTAKRLRWDQIFAHNYFKSYEPSNILNSTNPTESQFIQEEFKKRNDEIRLVFIDDSLKFQKDINEFLTKVTREALLVMHQLKLSAKNQILLMLSSAMMVLLISSKFKRWISEKALSQELSFNIEDIQLLMKDRTKYTENLNWINSQFYNMANYIEDLKQKTQQLGKKFQPETIQLIKDISNTPKLDDKFIETYNKIIKQCIRELYLKISPQQNSSFLLTEAMKSIIKLFYCLYPFKFRINEIEVILLENEINLKNEKSLKEEIQTLIQEHQLIIA